MIQIDRVEHEVWLSNAYLVATEGQAVLIDGNDRLDELVAKAAQAEVEIRRILLTHWHHDHVAGVAELAATLGVPVSAHPDSAEKLDFPVEQLRDGERLEVGGLAIDAIDTPGHADGHLALLVNGTDCFTGDALFRGTVGGTMAPGAPGFEAQKDSIMNRLMKLPPQTRLHPGHREPTTVAEEWEHNPFIRIWRGLDPEGDQRCVVQGERPATLVLWAPDYDGTNKAWVRFEDGSEGVIGGSQVSR